MIQYALEIVVIVIMAYIIFEMYRRIEVNHPVFFLLFVNLLATEVSLLVDLTLMISMSPVNLAKAFIFNNYLCLQFHTVSWLVLSIQRYFYIVQPHWLHKTFPNVLSITIVSALVDLTLFIVCAMIFLPSFSFCGGPGDVFNLDPGMKLLCLSWQLSSNSICIIFSSLIYAVVLRQRGKFKNSKVGIGLTRSQEDRIISISQRVEGRVHRNSNLERNSSDGNPLPSQGSVNYSNLSDVNSRDDEKRNSEIRASLRSLKTNLMIIVVTLASAAILNHSPHEINTPIISAIKASSPVVTMFANFGKVKEYIEELKESFRAYYTSYCDKWLCDYKL